MTIPLVALPPVLALLLAAPRGLDAQPLRLVARADSTPVARGVVLRELADSTWWPEGVDHDPRIVRFALAASGDSVVAAQVIDQSVALAPEPTIGTMVGDRFVYVANSQWDEHDDAGRVVAGARLTRPRLVAVPVPDRTP